MTNPCRRHFERVTAAVEAATIDPTQTMAGATAYEHQLNQLLQDRLRLKQVQSNQGKAELKRQLLPSYEPYVQGVLEGGQGAQDEVMTTVMVWRFDAGDFSGGLDIATYVLKHRMVMPDRFARTLGCLVAEEVATAAFRTQKIGGSFDLAILHRTAELTDAEDMPDQARAKLFLAMGRATLEDITEETPGQSGQLQAGVDLLKKAIALHDACGGKKDLERAERLLNKRAGPAG
ncbi:terminase endonuclease subunit [Pseudomonas mediterranea]|uniref:phage terminase small subunit n=1 Tax=Pseudomonas mediterranea TaxID=183795 RepID=UPI003BF4AADC